MPFLLVTNIVMEIYVLKVIQNKKIFYWMDLSFKFRTQLDALVENKTFIFRTLSICWIKYYIIVSWQVFLLSVYVCEEGEKRQSERFYHFTANLIHIIQIYADLGYFILKYFWTLSFLLPKKLYSGKSLIIVCVGHSTPFPFFNSSTGSQSSYTAFFSFKPQVVFLCASSVNNENKKYCLFSSLKGLQ